MSHNVVFACVLLVGGFSFLITLILASSFSTRLISKPKRFENKSIKK